MRYFLLLMLLPITYLFATTTGKITGRIIDQTTGEPLPFANVVIEGTTLGAATDIDGHYFILNVPPGEYTLSALMMGYDYKKVKEVRLSVGFTTVCNFELPPTILEREEIVVTAERKIIRPDLTSSLAIVSARDIETMPVQNFRDILSLQAGVVKGHIRGGRSGEVAYLIDGVSVTDAYSGDIALDRKNDENIVICGFNFHSGSNYTVLHIPIADLGVHPDSTYYMNDLLNNEYIEVTGSALSSFGINFSGYEARIYVLADSIIPDYALS